MNAGKDAKKALEQAKANAKSSGVPWLIHFTQNVYWVEKFDTQEDSIIEKVVLPDGTVLSAAEAKRMRVISIIPYPATQFHVQLRHRLTPATQAVVDKAIRIVFSGFIHAEYTPQRVIITTSCPESERKNWRDEYARIITEALDRHGA